MTRSFGWTVIVPFVILAIVSSILLHSLWQNWYLGDMEQLIEDQWLDQIKYINQLEDQDEVTEYLTHLVRSNHNGVLIDIMRADLTSYWSSQPDTFEQRKARLLLERYIDEMKTSQLAYYVFQKPDLELQEDYLYIIYSLDSHDEMAQYFYLTFPIEQFIDGRMQYKKHVVFIFITILAFLGSAVGFYIWKTISQPLNQITVIAQQVTEGQFENRIHTNRKDEFAKLANTLNKMIMAIREKVSELSDEKSRLEGVLHNMLSGVLLINIKGQVRYVNPSAEKILHVSKEQLILKSYQQVFDRHGLSNYIEYALQKGEMYRDQIQFKNLSTSHVVEVNIVPIRNINRLINSVIVVMHDITEIKRLEQVRAEFVANVSHELKTPVTSIKGFAETIIDGAVDNREELIEFVNIIYKEADRLSKLVHDLLELSKIEANDANLDKSYDNMVLIAKEIINNLQHEADKSNKHLYFYSNRDVIVHSVDRDRIKQVFINLISNSIAYSREGANIFVRVFDNDNDIVIEVEDNGMGIPEKDIPRIFERFYRVQKDRSRATGGTGLGLSIVKHIVEVHEGNIEVESKVGVGTTFRISFPKDIYSE